MSEWYYSEFGQTKGPVSESSIVNKVLKQELELDDYVMQGGEEVWIKIKDLPDLMEELHKPEPIPHQVVFGPEFYKDGIVRPQGNLYFYIPIRRFILMTIISFGLYQLYWFYKQWHCWAVKHKQGHKSFDREAGWFLFELMVFEKIETDKELNAVYRADFNGRTLFLMWLLIGGIGGLSYVFTRGNTIGYMILSGLCGILALVFLLPVQNYINRVNAKLGNSYDKPGLGHYLCIAAGIAAVLMVISVGSLMSLFVIR